MYDVAVKIELVAHILSTHEECVLADIFYIHGGNRSVKYTLPHPYPLPLRILGAAAGETKETLIESAALGRQVAGLTLKRHAEETNKEEMMMNKTCQQYFPPAGRAALTAGGGRSTSGCCSFLFLFRETII